MINHSLIFHVGYMVLAKSANAQWAREVEALRDSKVRYSGRSSVAHAETVILSEVLPVGFRRR